MKIFISWSGSYSKGVAEVLRAWLPNVLQAAEPFLSITDIQAGQDFQSVLGENLAQSDFGIVCVTRENCASPWILFEAGAIARTFERSNVCPYLVDISSDELPSPLSFFQAVSADEDGTIRLVEALNSASPSLTLSEAIVRQAFERWWPDLSSQFTKLRETSYLGPASATGEFFIFNTKFGKCLQATGAKRKDGAPLALKPYTGNQRQRWSFHELDDSSVAIKSAYTGQVLDGRSSGEGVEVHQWKFHGGGNQKWLLDPKTAGDCWIRCEHTLRCVTFMEDDGLVQRDEFGSRRQIWRIIPLLPELRG